MQNWCVFAIEVKFKIGVFLQLGLLAAPRIAGSAAHPHNRPNKLINGCLSKKLDPKSALKNKHPQPARLRGGLVLVARFSGGLVLHTS